MSHFSLPLRSTVLSALLATLAMAQPPCYETNLGTALLLGDDQTVDRPLGFSFPFRGGSTSTIGICSNGFVWLAAGQTNADFSPTVSEFLGSAQVTPRLAPSWRDFNPAAAGSDDVYFNNTIPGRSVITWHRLLRFGGTTPITVQLQMLPDGSFYVLYDSIYDTTGGDAILVGIKAAAGVVTDPGATDYSVALPISITVPTSYEFFATAATFDMRNRCLRFVPNGLGYVISFRNDCGASASVYGVGCPAVAPLTLAASGPPYLGSNFTWMVTGVSGHTAAAALSLGFGPTNFDLTPFGFVGCSAYTTMDLAVALPFSPPTAQISAPIPASPTAIGLALHAQAIVVLSVTVFTSNGLTTVFGKQ